MSRSDEFAIELLPLQQSREEDAGPATAAGSIVIGAFTEAFTVPLGIWDESGYRRSWQRAFEVPKGGPHATSCLMTSMTDPATSSFLACWPMYRDGQDVVIQHAIIFPGETAGAFDPAAPLWCTAPHRAAGEDGNKIAEWRTSMDSLRRFFVRDTT